MSRLLHLTGKGLYCEAGDFYIDPSRGVENAVITHAHSDHARRGSRNYFTERSGVGLLEIRLGAPPKAGAARKIQGFRYGEPFQLGSARVSFHSAGHILGSSQVRIETGGRVWVVSGDYKREPDPTCDPFEIVPCDAFVTEATFGTPRYRWEKSRELGREIFEWWMGNATRGRNSLLFGYSLGKAQRILGLLEPYAKEPNPPILVDDSIEAFNIAYRREGVRLARVQKLSDAGKGEFHGRLILAPPSIENSPWAERLGDYETAFASGWMAESGGAGWRARTYDRGFVISDHADWTDLNATIHDTGAREVYVLHRGDGALVKHLRGQGLRAFPAEKLAEVSAQPFLPGLLE